MKVLIYSKTRLFAECLASGLAKHEDVDCALGAYDLVAFQHDIKEQKPCVAIMDFSNEQVWEEARVLQPFCESTVLLGLSVSDSPEDLVRCAKVGCLGVVPYDSTIERTVAFIRQALRGELRCSPLAAAELARALSDTASERIYPMPECLTRRESEVCNLVCEGLTNKQIARELNCSEGTIKNHMHSILSKLNVSRRSAVPHQISAHRAFV